MPLPYGLTSIPNGIAGQAGPPAVGGLPSGLSPQIRGFPPGLSNMAMAGMGSAEERPDLFQRVAMLITQNPLWIAIFAGMGLREALEKSGRYESKPHRSNDELQQRGYEVGMPGQTGMQMPPMVQRPPMPGGIV